MSEKRITRGLCVGAALIALSGCVKPLPVAEEPVIGGVKSSVAQERLGNGTSPTLIRAYIVNDAGQREEVNAQCRLESAEVLANAASPSRVLLAKFAQRAEFENRGRPSDLSVTCEYNGQTGVTVTPASGKSAATAINAGLAAAIITTVVTSAVASATPWVYPDTVHVNIGEGPVSGG